MTTREEVTKEFLSRLSNEALKLITDIGPSVTIHSFVEAWKERNGTKSPWLKDQKP